jgi:hypothetical protein
MLVGNRKIYNVRHWPGEPDCRSGDSISLERFFNANCHKREYRFTLIDELATVRSTYQIMLTITHVSAFSMQLVSPQGDISTESSFFLYFSFMDKKKDTITIAFIP